MPFLVLHALVSRPQAFQVDKGQCGSEIRGRKKLAKKKDKDVGDTRLQQQGLEKCPWGQEATPRHLLSPVDGKHWHDCWGDKRRGHHRSQ